MGRGLKEGQGQPPGNTNEEQNEVKSSVENLSPLPNTPILDMGRALCVHVCMCVLYPCVNTHIYA